MVTKYQKKTLTFYRETAEWLSHHTGRKLTGMGLREVLKRVIHKGW